MRKRLNVKLIAGLIGGALLFLIAVVLLHDRQVKKNAVKVLQRANVAEEEGDLDESIRLLSRYIRYLDPDHDYDMNVAEEKRRPLMFKKLALISKKNLFDKHRNGEKQIERADINQAMYLMEEAVRKNGSDEEIRREAADFWFKFQRYDYAIDNLEVFRDSWTPEDKFRYIDSLRLQGGESEEVAIGELQKVVGLNPETGEFDDEMAEDKHMLNAYSSLVALLMQKRLDRVQAEKVANRLVEVNKDNYKAYLMRSRLLPMILGPAAKDQVHADIDRAFGMASGELDTKVAMALKLLGDMQLEEANRLVEESLAVAESVPEKAQLYNLKAQIAIQGNDTDGALVIIDQALDVIKRDKELLWKKARILLDRQEFEAVEALYKPLEQALTPSAKIGYLRARIMMSRGDVSNAVKDMARIRPLLDPRLQYQVDVYLARGYAATNQLDLRLATVRRLLAFQPDNASAQEGLIQTLSSLGRTDEALAFTRNTIRELVGQKKEVPQNLRNLEAALDMQVTLGQNSEELSGSEERRIRTKITNIWKNTEIPEAQRRSMVISLLKLLGKPEKVKEFVKGEIKKDPSSTGLYQFAIDASESQAEAMSYLSQMKEHLKPEEIGPGMALMEARIAVRFAPENAAAVIKSVEQGIGQYEDAQQAALFYELGRLQMDFLKNREEGRRLLEIAAAKAPKRVDILSKLLEDAQKSSDPNRITELVNRIQAVTSTDDDTWRMAEAGRIVWFVRNGLIEDGRKANSIGQARGLVEKVRSNRPEWLPVLLLETDINLLSGDTEQALTTLNQAISLQPNNANLIRLQANILKQAGRAQEGYALMETLPLAQRSSNDNKAKLELLWQRRNSWQQKEADQAVELANVVVPADSDDWRQQVLRAQILGTAAQPYPKNRGTGDAKKYAAAESAARRAISLEKNVPDVWVTLVTVLANQEKTSEAQTVIQEAEVELDESTKPLVIGQCYAILGDHGKALAAYQTALQADQSNAGILRLAADSLMKAGKINEATGIMNQIITKADPAKHQKSIVWARRTLASLLANVDSYEAFNKGLELLEANAVDEELSPEDLAIWVSSCLRRPERQSWQLALSRLNKVSTKRSLSDSELFLKAQLLERFGDDYWDQVQSIARDVLLRQPNNQRMTDAWVLWLLKRADTNDSHLVEATKWAQNNLGKDSVTRLRVEAHSLVKANRVQDAVKKLNALRPDNAATAINIRALLTVASIAEELGKYGDKRFYGFAEKCLSQLAKEHPEYTLRLATLRGMYYDTPRVKAAIQTCLTLDQERISPANAAGAAIGILRKHPDKWNSDLRQEVAAVGSWMEQKLASNQKDLPLNYHLAEFYDMTGSLDRVEQEYKKLLDSPEFADDIERGTVLNNLAYAMALNGKGDTLDLLRDAENFLGPTSDLYDTRGYVHLVRGEVTEAVQNFKIAIENGTPSSQKLFHLSLAYEKQGNAKLAAETWRSALKSGLDIYKIPIALRKDFENMRTKYGSTAVAKL